LSSNLSMQDGVMQWAIEELGGADVHGAQRAQIIRVVSQLARRPHGLISKSMRSDADRQSAYGLLNGAVTPEALADCRNGAAVRRASEYANPIVPIDGSAVTITDTKGTKEIGRIGSPPSTARGLKVMSAVVLSPKRVPLGVVAQDYWTRSEQPHRKNHAKRPFKERETSRWVSLALTVAALFEKHAPNSIPWFQLDREGDFAEMLLCAVANRLLITIRANHDRPSGKQGSQQLWSTLRCQDTMGTYRLHVEPGPNRPERDADIVVRACQVGLWLGKGAKKQYAEINAVHAIEKNPPCGAKRIEWLLLTTHTVNTFADAERVIDAYGARWSIEEFHRTWKSGLCNVEKTQLRSATRSRSTLSSSHRLRCVPVDSPISPVRSRICRRVLS
jgi:hypothetical protein